MGGVLAALGAAGAAIWGAVAAAGAATAAALESAGLSLGILAIIDSGVTAGYIELGVFGSYAAVQVLGPPTVGLTTFGATLLAGLGAGALIATSFGIVLSITGPDLSELLQNSSSTDIFAKDFCSINDIISDTSTSKFPYEYPKLQCGNPGKHQVRMGGGKKRYHSVSPVKKANTQSNKPAPNGRKKHRPSKGRKVAVQGKRVR